MSRKEKERKKKLRLMKEGRIEGGEIFHIHTKEKKMKNVFEEGNFLFVFAVMDLLIVNQDLQKSRKNKLQYIKNKKV